VRGPLYLHTLVGNRIAPLAHTGVILAGDFPRPGRLDRRHFAQDDAAGLALDFILEDPRTGSRIPQTKTKAWDVLIKDDAILLAIGEIENGDT
jgi:hypothetical protein